MHQAQLYSTARSQFTCSLGYLVLVGFGDSYAERVCYSGPAAPNLFLLLDGRVVLQEAVAGWASWKLASHASSTRLSGSSHCLQLACIWGLTSNLRTWNAGSRLMEPCQMNTYGFELPSKHTDEDRSIKTYILVVMILVMMQGIAVKNSVC